MITRRALFLVLAIVAVAGCATMPAATPITEDEAVDLVLSQQSAFAGIGPVDPQLIGQSAWYEVTETNDGWTVVVRIGWGDCPAGCIDEHRWTYDVSPTGGVRLVDESGEPVPSGSAVHGVVLAGPTCPVVTDPPDPSCADRPVAGAELVVTTLDGAEITRATTDVNGEFSLDLAPGAYRLVPQPVDGLMGTAEEVEFSIEAGVPAPELAVSYDTGIR